MTKKDKEVYITRDWNRPNPLEVENLDPSKSYRWTDKNKLDQKRYEGWEPVQGQDVKHRGPDGRYDGETKEYRELILCEMPKELADSRNNYFREKARMAEETARQEFHKEGRRLGFSTFEK